MSFLAICNNKVKPLLNRMFLTVFLILFAVVTVFTLFAKFNIITPILSVVYLTLIIFLDYIIIKQSKKRHLDARTLTIILIVLFLPLQIYLGKKLMVTPSWDFGYIYNGALSILKSGTIKDPSIQYYSGDFNSYFEACPNNLGMLVLLTIYFKVISFFKEPDIFCGIVLNIICIDLGFYIFICFMKKAFSNKKALLAILLWISFLPFWLYIPIFYTDTVTIPFSVGGIYLLYLVMNAKRTRSKVCLSIAIGVLLAVGTLLKTSIAILFIGGLLYVVFSKKGLAIIKYSLILILSFVMVCGSFQHWTHNTTIVDMSNEDQLKKPYTHFLMMGLRGVGGWNSQDTSYTINAIGSLNKKSLNVDVIKIRLDNYGFFGTCAHLLVKSAYTWGDGTYYAPVKLSRKPVNDTVLHEYVLRDGSYYGILKNVCNGFQFLLLLLMLLSLISGLKEKRIDILFLVRITIFGVFAFLMLWETRSRYLLNFVPLIFIMWLDGYTYLLKIIKTRFPNKQLGKLCAILSAS